MSQFNEVLISANLDPSVFTSVTKKLDDVLDNRNALIQDLQYKVARASKTHNDSIRTYKSRLSELGIPHDELDFALIPTSTSTVPAGLVVKRV